MGTQYIAFLRAINVGGRVVKMTELKKIFEAARLSDVETFIASGNVIFTCGVKDMATLGTKVESALQKALGYPVATMLRTTGEVVAAAEYQAFTPKELGAASLYVGFLKGPAAADAIKKTLAMRTDIDDLHVHGREVYWLARKNIQEATITGAAIEKTLATPVTFRNINTVRRLAAKYAAGGG
jgi:uncharacterized protein (DUF1697 family)